MTPPPTHRRLLLFSASFPFGQGEPFLAAEMPFLEAVFDEIVIIASDLRSPQAWPVGPSVRCERIPYGLTAFEKLLALRAVFEPAVMHELRSSRRRSAPMPLQRVTAAVLSSWQRARKFGQRAQQIAREQPGSRLYAYSYWATDMAVAAARARARGIVHRAIARAHGWDVYSSRPEVGILPFRAYLAQNLDALLFVSEDGRGFFDAEVEGGRALREVVRLGTTKQADGPQGRGEPFTIVSCSSLTPLKRIELLARAVASSTRPVSWTHVGDGPQRSEIERVRSSAPAHVNIELTGQLLPVEVMRTWRRLKPAALVNVSSSEGVPVSMMEAMSLGIPVIGTHVGGVPEIVTHGVNGHLLSKDPSIEEIAQVIGIFADMPRAMSESLAAGAWRTWNEKFRADINFPRLTSILAPPAGGHPDMAGA